MTQKTPIPCPNCDREKYFEGLCYACNNRKTRAHYEQLTGEQIAAMTENIIAKIETIEAYGEVYKDFIGLLAYQDINTEKIADAAFQNSIFYPSTLYRNASEEVQDGLIARLLKPDCKEANHLLSCLAIVGSKKVEAAFYHLEHNPLPWRKKLYVNPSVYAEVGGWTFDERGNRMELDYPRCFALTAEEGESDAVKVAEPTGENCPVCNCQTVNMLTLNGNDPRLAFLQIPGTVKLPLCPNCASMCEKTIIRYGINGESTFEITDPFETENYISEADFEKMTANKLALSQVPKPLYFAGGNDDVSTIGGHPDWVQDAQYENCPDCQKKMKLLAAITWDQILEHSEGTLYLEICTDCSVALALHQQT